MKRFMSLLMLLVMLVSLSVPAQAATATTTNGSALPSRSSTISKKESISYPPNSSSTDDWQDGDTKDAPPHGGENWEDTNTKESPADSDANPATADNTEDVKPSHREESGTPVVSNIAETSEILEVSKIVYDLTTEKFYLVLSYSAASKISQIFNDHYDAFRLARNLRDMSQYNPNTLEALYKPLNWRKDGPTIASGLSKNTLKILEKDNLNLQAALLLIRERPEYTTDRTLHNDVEYLYSLMQNWSGDVLKGLEGLRAIEANDPKMINLHYDHSIADIYNAGWDYLKDHPEMDILDQIFSDIYLSGRTSSLLYTLQGFEKEFTDTLYANLKAATAEIWWYDGVERDFYFALELPTFYYTQTLPAPVDASTLVGETTPNSDSESVKDNTPDQNQESIKEATPGGDSSGSITSESKPNEPVPPADDEPLPPVVEPIPDLPMDVICVD